MRVGHNNRWGYSFKPDSATSLEQEAILGSHLARLDNTNNTYFKHSILQSDEQEHYLPDNIKSIMGIGDKDATTSIGIIWNMDQENTLEAIYYAALEDEYDYYPYLINKGKRYCVKDGEVYEEANGQ